MKNPDMEYFRKPRKGATDQSRVEKLYRDPSAFKNELGAKPVMTNKPMPVGAKPAKPQGGTGTSSNRPPMRPGNKPKPMPSKPSSGTVTTMPIKPNKPRPTKPGMKPAKPTAKPMLPGSKPMKPRPGKPQGRPLMTNKPKPRPTTKPIKPGTVKKGM